MADGLDGQGAGLQPDRRLQDGKPPGPLAWPLFTRLAVGMLWIITTAAAGFIGATATSYSDRARPSIAISDIRLSSELNDKLHPALPKNYTEDTLFTDIDNNVWLGTVDLSDAGTAYTSLTENEAEAADVIKVMRRFNDRYDTMMSLLDGDSSTTTVYAFFDQIQSLGHYIRNVIEGEGDRGTFDLPALKAYPPGTRKLIITPAKQNAGTPKEHKELQVHKPGSLYSFVVNVTSNAVSEEQLSELAYALAYFDRQTLKIYLEEVKKDGDTLARMEKMKEGIATDLNGLEHLQVNVLISNSGSKPISIAPDAALYINTVDAANFKDNTTIRVALYDQTGHPAPVTVSGGESRVLQFTSVNILADLDNWRDLITLFNNHSRDCFIAVETAGTEWQQNSQIFSRNSHFGLVNPRGFLNQNEIASHFR